MGWRWVSTSMGRFGVTESADDRRLWLSLPDAGGGPLTPGEARELALELQAAAERIDPQPPPRSRRETGRGRGR